ncbi:hypothetical protein [Adhaeribacter rhizoryzae]|uniref:Uncharacterized protein n=1 Tax=Adhaeribacter rhizoryzae TaxID=2607907 RepID=A0A5M6D3S7_9BACT|nr:hypothetical protein [Adhaeribacter rhizoryzae]KAA5541973.1 hypothetical protein F0145_19495 [Adhaeribacter rhizoryzae]
MPKQKQHIKMKATSLNTTPAGKDSWLVRRIDAFIECSFTKEVEKVNTREDKIWNIYGRHLTRLWWVICVVGIVVITLHFPKLIPAAGLVACYKPIMTILKIFK